MIITINKFETSPTYSPISTSNIITPKNVNNQAKPSILLFLKTAQKFFTSSTFLISATTIKEAKTAYDFFKQKCIIKKKFEFLKKKITLGNGAKYGPTAKITMSIMMVLIRATI